MVRNVTRIEIIETLDSHKYFSSADFDIKIKGNSINLKYEYDDRFYFKINLPTRTTTKTVKRTKPPGILGERSYNKEEDIEIHVINGKVCPGEMILEEDLRIEGKDNISSRIKDWLYSIWEELKAGPVNKLIDEQNEIIENIKAKVDKVSEDYFTKKEANELREKLNLFEDSLKKQIEQQSEENGNIRSTIRELENEIEVLKSTIDVLNKKNWFKSSITKMYKWISKENNRKLLKDGAKLLKPLLPESVKDVID